MTVETSIIGGDKSLLFILDEVITDYENDGWDEALFELQHLTDVVRKSGERQLNKRETVALASALNDYQGQLDGYPAQLQQSLVEAGW